MYDHISSALWRDDFWYEFQLGRTWDSLGRNNSEPTGKLIWNLHSDSYQLGKWLHEHCDRTRESEHDSSRRQCNRWDADLYNNVSCSLCSIDIGDRLQLGRAGHCLWWNNSERDC